jgi:hypothetical protein
VNTKSLFIVCHVARRNVFDAAAELVSSPYFPLIDDMPKFERYLLAVSLFYYYRLRLVLMPACRAI